MARDSVMARQNDQQQIKGLGPWEGIGWLQGCGISPACNQKRPTARVVANKEGELRICTN